MLAADVLHLIDTEAYAPAVVGMNVRVHPAAYETGPHTAE